jgi:E3 ubiquitin-protein ligase UBR1
MACDCGNRSAFHNDDHLGCSSHPPLPPGVKPPHHPISYTSDAPIPDDLIDNIHKTVAQCLDFVIRTFQVSPLPTEHGHLPKDFEEMQAGDPLTSGEEAEGRAKGPWSVILFGDDKHVGKEVARQIRDALGTSQEDAEMSTRELEAMVS